MKRRPLTKTHLLPLPAGLVRQQQLRHHVAWSLLLDQRAEPAQLAILLHMVEITYLLASPEEREVVSTARFRQAEAALEACFDQLDEGGVTLERPSMRRSSMRRSSRSWPYTTSSYSVFRAIDTSRRMSAYNNSRRLDDQRFLVERDEAASLLIESER
ncbi:hypothetical protein [Burkholderia gladioli]|uniref:hypothetical protein n=1 Tax=Burkholderia gladioli TaxID=28095 RepID=UPI002FE34037